MKTDKHSVLFDLRGTWNNLHENFHHFLCGKEIENCQQMACFAAIIQHIWIDMHTDMQGDTITMFYHSLVHNTLYRHGQYVRSFPEKCLVFIHRCLRGFIMIYTNIGKDFIFATNFLLFYLTPISEKCIFKVTRSLSNRFPPDPHQTNLIGIFLSFMTSQSSALVAW